MNEKILKLKSERTQKFNEMQAIVDGVEKAKRDDMNDDEQSKWENLDNEIKALDKQIERLERQEQLNARFAIDHSKQDNNKELERETLKYDLAKAIREYAEGGITNVSGREKEINQEMNRSVKSSGLIIPYSRANENTTSTHAAIIPVNIGGLSVVGKKPLHQQMGVKVLPGLQGTLKFPYKSPDVATNGTPSNNSNNPTGVTMAPERFGITDNWAIDLLASQSKEVHAELLADMLTGIDRALTKEAYTIALAAATETASGALTKAGMSALMATCDVDEGAFAMDRASFFSLKDTDLGTDTGRMLASIVSNGHGKTYEGVDAWYSNLFEDGTDQQYLLFGDWSKLLLGEWGGIEMIIDPYTNAIAGTVQVTINKMADIICRDANAFVKSPDLDV